MFDYFFILQEILRLVRIMIAMEAMKMTRSKAWAPGLPSLPLKVKREVPNAPPKIEGISVLKPDVIRI